MNTILVYSGAIFLSILTVISIDGITMEISQAPDDDLWAVIAITNGILAVCLIAILLISKVG